MSRGEGTTIAALQTKIRSLVASTARLSPKEKAELREAAGRGRNEPLVVPATRLSREGAAEARAFLKELDSRTGPPRQPSPEVIRGRDENLKRVLLSLLPELSSEIAKEERRLQRALKKRAARKGSAR